MLNMNATSLLIGLLLGAALGGTIGYLLARGRQAGVAADLTGQARAADERARAATERAALIDRAAQEKAALLDGQLADRFRALSAQPLDQSTRTFLELAQGKPGAASAKATHALHNRHAPVQQLLP